MRSLSFDERVRITRFLNLAENDSGLAETDYKTIYLYSDGNKGRKQVTLARGFTQDGGNLGKVLDRYVSLGGSRASFFNPYIKKMGDGNLYKDTDFLKTLSACAVEVAMQKAQDEVFEECYINPALEWATKNGFVRSLSIAVIVDSFLHSGTIPPFLQAKFKEKTPSNGGEEKAWIFQYLVARFNWFSSSKGILRSCVFRPKFFLEQIATISKVSSDAKLPKIKSLGGSEWELSSLGNWAFACPLTIAEKGKICG